MTPEYDESDAGSALAGAVSGARQRFDAMCVPLRPVLHRFCTRMTGSPCDAEDVLQDALVVAFYRLDELENAAAFRAWLFRIVHNKCIDLLRTRRREPWLESAVEPEAPAADLAEAAIDRERAERALAHIATELPPRERACIMLCDVLDWSLEETAQITESSVGAVKAALHRARTKLVAAERVATRHQSRLDPDQREVVRAYLTAFNQRNWDAVQALLADDAQLEIVHRSEGRFKDARYFVNYGKLAWSWKLELAAVDGVERVVHFRQIDGAWSPHTIVELGISSGKVTRVRDYIHVDYLLKYCAVAESAERSV